MSIEANKAIIYLVWEEINKGNLAVIDKYFADSFVRYTSDGQEMDREGYKNLCTVLQSTFPDIHFNIDDMVAEGNRVAFRFTWSGTNTSDMMDGAVKDKHFSITEDYFCRFDGSKIVEFRNLLDRLSWFEQAGISPPVTPED